MILIKLLCKRIAWKNYLPEYIPKMRDLFLSYYRML